MNLPRPTLIVGCLLAVGLGLAAVLFLRHRNAELRRQIAHARTQRGSPGAPAATTSHAEPSQAATAAIVAARRELAELEGRDQRNSAPASSDLTPPGLTRLENLHNVGQQTPGGAVQTLLWASFRGEDQTLASALLLEPDARAKAAEFLAALPDSARAKLPTPESFAALFLSEGLTNVTAVRIGDATAVDPENATVRVEGIMGPDLQLPVRRSARGWQVVIGEKQVDWAITRLRPASAR